MTSAGLDTTVDTAPAVNAIPALSKLVMGPTIKLNNNMV